MKKDKYKVYCAGPLFNPKEREEMGQIALVLEDSGHSVFLPQRDGLEFAKLFPCLLKKGIRAHDAQRVLNMAIFSLDVFQIISSDGLLLNMNGRVPDEGAMVEAGIAWAHDKVIVIFRSDSRSLIEGNCNPLVLGLSDFTFVSSYDEISTAFEAKFSDVAEDILLGRDRCFEVALKSGKEISEYLADKRSGVDITNLLIDLFKEKLCQSGEDPKENCSQTSATIRTHGRRRQQGPDEFRTDFQRDVHRIIYCQSFRRLRHKAQVFYFPQNDHISTRMDHVRFVASAARTVARCLGLNEDLAEAIGLAHDIGHPPFGHQGEEFLSVVFEKYPVLKELMPKFSHEVYGLRVVDLIAKRDRESPGLNLTWEVRDGIVSHCGEDFRSCRLEPASQKPNLENIRSREEAGSPATLEGCIVRLIDKIAYAGKDVEDALEVGIIKEKEVPSKFLDALGKTNGQIIGTFVEDMVRNSDGKDYISISLGLGDLLHELIQFNGKYIYHSKEAEGYKSQAKKTILYLFEDLKAEIERTKRFQSHAYPSVESNSVPAVYRVFRNFVMKDMKNVYKLEDPDELIVLDFIAGMTDSFAIRSVSDVFIPKMIV